MTVARTSGPGASLAAARLARLRVAVVVVVLAVAGAEFAVRVREHSPNVDDYLYALQTSYYLHGIGTGHLVAAWQAFGHNSPLVPMLALPLALVSSSPSVLALVELPLLVLLVAGTARLLQACTIGARASWLAAGLLGILPPVLDYAVMLHYAVAATAGTVWSLDCYLRSDRLRRGRYALALGLALALTSLSRVVAPVYVVAVALVVAVDLLSGALHGRASGRASGREWSGHALRNGAAAGTVALAVAAPWWLACRTQALGYLTAAGYDPRSGFAPARSALGRAGARVAHTVEESGLAVSVGLALGVALALVLLARSAAGPAARPLPGRREVLLVLATATLIVEGLCTSTNLGTSFAMPVVVLAGVASAWALLRLPGQAPAARPGRAARGAVAAAAALALATTGWQLSGKASPALASEPLFLSGYAGHRAAVDAVGSLRVPGSAAATRRVLAHLPGGTGRTLLVRDDDLVNHNGLAYLDPGREVDYPPFAATRLTGRDLAGVTSVIAGSSLVPYHSGLNPRLVTGQLQKAGFHRAWSWRLSTHNDLQVWVRAGSYPAPASSASRRTTATSSSGSKGLVR